MKTSPLAVGWILPALLCLLPSPGNAGPTFFEAAVAPILEARCVRCHGDEKVKGKLRLDSAAGLRDGGSGGPSLDPGDAAASEIYFRITLPDSDEDRMPPKGDPLTPGQVDLIRWWINRGAPFDRTLDDLAPPDAIRSSLADLPTELALVTRDPEPATKLERRPPTDDWLTQQEPMLQALRAQGAVASPLYAGSSEIVINFSVQSQPITNEDLETLAPLANHIVSLNLAGTAITDEGLKTLRSFPALARLHLEHTSVTDAGLRHLSALSELRYLNLVSTRVTDSGLPHLATLPKLDSLYVWQTQVTEEGARQLRIQVPSVDVVRGYSKLDPD